MPRTVGDLLKHLRGITGHLGRRDRTLVMEAIEAIYELSSRLHEATHPEPKPRMKVTLERIPDETPTEGPTL